MEKVVSTFPLISSRVHGMLDYCVGVALLALPFVLGFVGNNAATWVMVACGGAALVYSPLTNYELGIVPVFSMRQHLILDAAWGAMLAGSPWMFDFADQVWLPHIIVGLGELAVVALSSAVPVGGPRRVEIAETDRAIDEAGMESFPASDPPAISGRR